MNFRGHNRARKKTNNKPFVVWGLALVCGLGTLSEARALTYAEWIAGYPSITGNATLATADPDGDTITNLMEYALDGMSPTAFSGNSPSLPKVYFSLRAEDGTYGTPTATAPTPAAVAAAGSYHLLIRWKPRSGITDLRYVPQTNQKDLEHWGWGDSAVTTWTDGDGYSWARTNSDMKVWSGRGFMRLRVEAVE